MLMRGEISTEKSPLRYVRILEGGLFRASASLVVCAVVD